MSTENRASKFAQHLVLPILLITLAGCLPATEEESVQEPAAPIAASDFSDRSIGDRVSGDRAAGDRDLDDEGIDSQPETIDQRISGSVGDGPVIGADIYVRANDGTHLATVVSSSTAEFDLVIRTKGNQYPLLITSTGGIDLVTSVEPDFMLQSVVVKPGKNTVANINPFTTIASEMARENAEGISEDSMGEALAVVSSKLNLGLAYMAGSAIMVEAIDASNIAEVMRSSEALGEVVRRTRDNLVGSGRTVSGDDVVAAIASDLTDGVLDGRGGSRTNSRISAVFGLAQAQVSIETMKNELRVQGSDASALIQNALVQVFDGTPDPGLSELTITNEMIDAARRGLTAANALQPAAELAALLAELDALSAGMSAAEVQSRLETDARISLETALVTVAQGTDSQVDQVNDVLRNGAEPSPDNSAPVISGQPAASVTADSVYSFQPTASDADGDTLTFSIAGKPSWASFNTGNGALSGTPDAGDVGVYSNITITVSDGEASDSIGPFSITVNALPVSNSAPVISGQPAASVTADSVYSFQPTASDADGDTLTFSIAGKPSWASFNTGNGALSGTPDAGDVGVYSNITITVSDGEASDSIGPFSITVSALPVSNSAPVISGQPAASVTAESAYSFQPTASDADGDALTFSIAGQPSWASFNTGNGALSGTPDAGDVGVYSNITITVSDGEDSASLGPFSITVSALPVSNSAPVISGQPAASVTAESAYSFQPTASDADGDTLTFSIAGKPSWASFNTGNGALSGTPDAGDVGAYSNITITVSDGEDSASLGPFSITVSALPVSNSAPVISGQPAASVTAESAYSFQPTASDADGDTLTFSIAGKPSWASFNTGNGALSGTPGAADVATYGNITITVSDGEDSASLGPFSITVSALPVSNSAPVISGQPAASVTAESAYSFQPTASDADGDTLTFSIAGKPSWASFNTGNGALSGTPGAADVATYGNITITVSDGEDSASLGPFSVSVDAISLGSVTLNWTPPTQNTDGSPLTDLAAYRIYWGAEQGAYTDSVTIDNAGLTTYVVENLSPGTWHFVSTAVNSAGVESDYSNPASKVVQ